MKKTKGLVKVCERIVRFGNVVVSRRDRAIFNYLLEKGYSCREFIEGKNLSDYSRRQVKILENRRVNVFIFEVTEQQRLELKQQLSEQAGINW